MGEIITLRGGLGTQLMTLFHAYANNMKLGLKPPIDEIQINVHKTPIGSRTDWISELFDVDIPCGIFETNQIIKNMNPCPEGYELALEYSSNILDNWLKLKYNDTHKVADTILHVRGADNQFISENKYIEVADYLKPTLIGDDKELIQRIVKRTGVDFFNQDAVDDWHTMLSAHRVYGGLSTFILSGNLLFPHRQVRILSKDNYDGPKDLTETSYSLFSECLAMLPNGSWL